MVKKKKDLRSQKQIIFKRKCNIWPDWIFAKVFVCDPKDGGEQLLLFYFKKMKSIFHPKSNNVHYRK